MLRFESEPACPSKLLIARCYSTIRARIRPNGFERILAHRIGCQRATASLSSRVASKQLCNYSEDSSECQHLETKKFRISTTFIRTPVSSLEGERYPQCTMCRGYSRMLGQVRKLSHALENSRSPVGSDVLPPFVLRPSVDCRSMTRPEGFGRDC